ncbi:MAG: anti-sigma factor family protein [Armatimonadota bacterium]
MRCEQFEELISAYIEHSIAPPLAAKMEEHAERCPACRAQLQGVQSLWEMMAEAPRVEPPASLHARIMREVDARVPVAPALRWWEIAWRPRFAFAAAAVLLLVAFILWPRDTGTTGAIALSVVSGGGSPVAPLKNALLPLRFEPFRVDTGELRWMVKVNTQLPTAIEMFSGRQKVWSGIVDGETVVVLPSSPQAPMLAVRVVWDDSNVLQAWLPSELAQDEQKPVMVLRQASIEQTLSRVAQAYGVPLALVGEADPLTRVNLESTGVTLNEMLQRLAEELHLQVSRAEDGITVLTAR